MHSVNIEELTISQISSLLKKGDISPVDLVNKMLENITNKDEEINSYITINKEKAIQDAIEAEREIANNHYKGPLHGVPIGIKDIIDTSGLKTTMGSKIYSNHIPTQNATVVEHLIQAGAIIIGKHNTHEFAYGATGDRSYYGPVRNPNDVSKITGGSSSGTAAAVASNLCYGGVGTDTGGSVRIPSAYCGIVGMKPTFGLISNQGVHPVSPILDHVGPMTRSIMDNALLLNAMTNNVEDFTSEIGLDIKNKKIGVPTNFYFDELDPEIHEKVTEAIDNFKKLGAEIVQIHIPNLDRFLEAQRIIVRKDAYLIHRDNLTRFSDDYDEEVKDRILAGENTSDNEYDAAMKVREQSRIEFNHLFENVDIILTPATSILPCNINQRELSDVKAEKTHIRWAINKLSSPTNLNGFPSLVVPAGSSRESLPIGIQLIGKENAEAELYRFGYAFEQANIRRVVRQK